jgi:hypothetical protein
VDMSCLGMIGLFATKGLQINSKRRAASSWNPHDVGDRSKVNWDNSHGKMFEERSRILQDLALVQGSPIDAAADLLFLMKSRNAPVL